jgi:hypothetical protein
MIRPLGKSKRLYANITAGQTATLTCKDADGNLSTALFILLDTELQAGGTAAKVYWAFDGDTPVASQGPGFYGQSQVFDSWKQFSSAKFVLAATAVNMILLIEIRGEEDLSGSTLTVA